MKNGNLIKEKIEYYKERLRTKEGIFDLAFGNFIWGFLVIKYNQLVFGTIKTFFSFIAWNWLRNYLSYTLFGLFLMPISVGISIILINTFKYLKKIKKSILGGK